MRTTYTQGQRIILKANEQEGWPEEAATLLETVVLGADEDPSHRVTMVEVAERQGKQDADGLREVTLDQIKIPIFVFGSNELGIHGAGAARAAKDYYGAKMGQGYGLSGNSFAVPTCRKPVGTPGWEMREETLKDYITRFKDYAARCPQMEFKVTQLGCGLAGWQAATVAPLFVNAPGNCTFDTAWKEFLPGKRFWGTA